MSDKLIFFELNDYLILSINLNPSSSEYLFEENKFVVLLTKLLANDNNPEFWLLSAA